MKAKIAILVLTAFGILGNFRKEPSSSGYISVNLTDRGNSSLPSSRQAGPEITAINLDIFSAEVRIENESLKGPEWIPLNVNAGIYNVMMFQDPLTALVAGETKLPSGNITGLRLTLGSANSVFVKGEQEYGLLIPEPDRKIELNVRASASAETHLSIDLNMDASRSVYTAGGIFYFKPDLQVGNILVH